MGGHALHGVTFPSVVSFAGGHQTRATSVLPHTFCGMLGAEYTLMSVSMVAQENVFPGSDQYLR